MLKILELANTYSGLGSLIVALIVFAYPICRWYQIKGQEADSRQFELYHKVIQEIVQGSGGAPFVHRQMAVVFELRNFPKYFPVSYRLLTSLHANWTTLNAHPDLLNELLLTKEFIKKKKRFWVSLTD